MSRYDEQGIPSDMMDDRHKTKSLLQRLYARLLELRGLPWLEEPLMLTRHLHREFAMRSKECVIDDRHKQNPCHKPKTGLMDKR